MEEVEGMLGRMNLSAAERKGISVEVEAGGQSGSAEPMAVGKVLAEKLVHADGLASALGRIWCPIRELGARISVRIIFFSPFVKHQGSGGR